MVNRSVVIVKAKEPFVRWLKSLPDPMDISLEDINEDATAYLLPDYSYDDEQDEILRRYYPAIFEEQLDGWWTEERDWPPTRTFALFTQWFDIEFHSLIVDLVDAPLEID
jgi:hypothetical protein